MPTPYDAIVVGARCAGSPTAMLLARKGYRVLLVDRATFPSDTISTHVIHPPGVLALRRWGLLDRLTATGCPPIDTYAFNFGPFTLSGSPGTAEAPLAYCARRTILDKLLVDAAVEAGVEVREAFLVEEILTDGSQVTGIKAHSRGGTPMTEKARVVIGADGRYSTLAAAVHPEQYHEKPPLMAGYYSYFSNLPMHGRFETYIRGDRGFAAAPTHDGLTLLVGGWPYAEFDTNKRAVEGTFMAMLERAPEFAGRVRAATREAPFSGAAVPNFFRKPYGPGWALVGDAGYNKDPITAQGISDAFRDAEACTEAIGQALSGMRPYDEALAAYQQQRDAHVLPMFELTTQLASFEPPPPEMQQLFAAISHDQQAMNAFVQMNAGVISPADFFAPAHIGAMMSRVQQPG